MPVYLAPGIYSRVQPQERDIRLLRTDVAGFAGFAEQGPLPSFGNEQVDPKTLVVRLTSWKAFTSIFGGFIPYGYLAYAVRAFFENGGTTCYVVRVAATHHSDPLKRPRAASFVLPGEGEPQEVTELAEDVVEGQTDLVVDDISGLAAGDTVAIVGDGVVEFAMVIALLDYKKVQIGRKTKIKHFKGTKVLKFSPAVSVTATSSGNWGNRIKLSVTPLEAKSVIEQFDLRVTMEPSLDASRLLEESYRNLSLIEKTSNNERNPKYAPDIINNNSQLIRLEVKQPRLLVRNGPLASGPVLLEGGRDGLNGVAPQDFTGGLSDLRGLRLLEEIDEVAILCAPDAVFATPPTLPERPVRRQDPCGPYQLPADPEPVQEDATAIPHTLDAVTIYRSMIDQCERLHDRVAILDFPVTLTTKETPVQALINWRNQFTTRFGAIYYPWLKVPDPLRVEGLSRFIPPSGHVAGVYARIDNQFGVQRPPANVAMEFVTDVVDEVTALRQEELNPEGINALRPFPGRGIRVWGARSLAGKEDWDWIFIHARRLMSMIEESVENSMQWAVFEPNDYALRRTLIHSLSVLLEAIWRTGGLKGAVPSEGFYVKCDETNNSPAVVEAGRLICEVGVAVAAPMEFLVFEIRQGTGGTKITER